MVRTLAHDHLADHAVRNRLLRFPPLICRRGLRTDLQDALGFPHRVDELLRFLVGVAHRLFEVNIFTPIHSFERNAGVPVVRSGDNHGIYVRKRKDFPIIDKTLGVVLVRGSFLPFFVHVGNSNNLASVVVLHAVFREGCGVARCRARRNRSGRC